MTDSENKHMLYPGNIYASKKECKVSTILGSCIAVCLWDHILKMGGINHYMLPLWNGEGLPSPRYGNIAIEKLIEKMYAMGCKKGDLKAKVFGGGAVLQNRHTSKVMNIGDRNIDMARDMLKDARIPIVAEDVGGVRGRKLFFNTMSGGVLMKKTSGS